jgi:hypothetical protein
MIKHVFDEGVVKGRGGVPVVGAGRDRVLPECPWGWLPEDVGRWAVPSDDAVAVEDLAPWDWPEEVVDETSLDALASDESELGPGPARAPWEVLAGVEDVPPDGMLALILEEVDVAAVDDRLLVEMVAAWQRVVAWAQLNAALAAGELSGRPAMNPQWRAPVPADTNVAADELAMRLGWSRRAGARLVRDGRALGNELLLTAEAVRDGRLDGARLRVMVERLHDRAPQLAWAVQEQVLPHAGTRTPRQLAGDVDRALLAVDPVDAADRLAAAVAARHVCHPRALPDGMAGIWAVLPAADAVRVDATLEATARAARALGDPHTLDQLRADILVALATGQTLPTSTGGEGGGVGSKASQITAGTVLPACSDTAPPAGHGAAAVDENGNDGNDGNDYCVGESADGAGPPMTGGSPPGRVGVRIPKVRVDVTVALSTLLGLDEAPAELAGFGPISAEQARALAAGGTWRRLVTDPLSGAVLDVGRTRYRPPQPMAEHVIARDSTCAGPGCPVPAARCDLDHTVEFHKPRAAAGSSVGDSAVDAPSSSEPVRGVPGTGRTAADNLGPLSHRCHRLKTDGGFTLRQVAPGVFEWHTPAGLAYRVVPGDHGHTERLHHPSATKPHPGYPDQPPF